MSELLACPFCGGAAVLRERLEKWHTVLLFRVQCESCVATSIECSEIPRAIAAWNRRASARPDEDADAQRDAARYRWLRSEEVATEPKYYQFWQMAEPKLCREERLDRLIDQWMERNLDAAIDAARAEGGEK